MHVAVLGAGIIGTLSAYYLSQKGLKVTVIDQHADVAGAASGANASQLSFKSIYSMASPSIVPTILETMFGFHSDLRIHERFNPSFLKWGSAFLWNCLPALYRKNSIALRGLADHSTELYAQIRSQCHLEYSYDTPGRLRLYTDKDELKKSYQNFSSLGLKDEGELEMLSASSCLEKNPMLSHIENKLVGGVYVRGDCVGDSAVFCKGLRKWIQAHQKDVCFMMNEKIDGFLLNGDCSVKGLKLSGGDDFFADYYIVCSGAYSLKLLNSIGYKINMYPVKGCSLSLPYSKDYKKESISHALTVGRLTVAPLDEVLRFSAGAIFDGFNDQADPKLEKALLTYIEDLFPGLAGTNQHKVHYGLRPVLPNSIPLAKEIEGKNIYINTGHGMWGWTLGPVTCNKIAEQITNDL